MTANNRPLTIDHSAGTTAWFIVGPTAVGKTAVAQWIAERAGCQILSADSMMVYRGMDIGTAKPNQAERSRVVYHGMDLVTPDRPFSVAEFLAHAVGVCSRSPGAVSGAPFRSQGDPGIIVAGGTGLYVKSLIRGLTDLPPPDTGARAHWNRVFELEGVAALQEALSGRSPELYESLKDPKNPRRLIRALELADAGVVQPARDWDTAKVVAPVAALRLPPEQLKRRIELRVSEMYRTGLVEEVESLLGAYPALSSTAARAIGYAEAIALVGGECSREEAVDRTVQRTRQLAKRQKTWFTHQVDVRWIDIELEMTTEEAAAQVLAHWREYGGTGVLMNNPG